MRLHSRPACVPHASAQGRRQQRVQCVSCSSVSGEGISVGEVWQRLATAGSASNGNQPPVARVKTCAAATTAVQSSVSAQVEFAACAWKVLLRAAELPLEQARSDHPVRARTRHLHHRALSKPPASATEKDLHRKAMFHARKGRSDEAVTLLQVGMERYPHNSFFPHSVGVMMSKRRQFHDAQKFLEQALDIDPGNSAALQALGGVHSKLGNGAKARSMFEEAAKERSPYSAVRVIVNAYQLFFLSLSLIHNADGPWQCGCIPGLGVARKKGREHAEGSEALRVLPRAESKA